MSEEVKDPTEDALEKLADKYAEDYFRTFEKYCFDTKRAIILAYCAGYRLGFMNAEIAMEVRQCLKK